MFSLFKRRPAEPGRVRIEPSGREITVPPDQSILQAALGAGIAFPHSCKVGTCMSCRSRLRSGRVKPIRDFSYVLSGEDLRAGYILACQAKVPNGEQCVLEVDTEVQVPAHPRRGLSTTISALRPLTHDILEVRLRAPESLVYTAGQYAELRLPGLERGRAFSFASRPDAGAEPELRFFVRKVAGGEFTARLFETARVGDAVELDGPLGSFYLREADAPLVCIAGGSGLAPIVAILQQALASGVRRDVSLLFGARTQRDLYALDEIADLAKAWPATFSFIPVLSDEPADSDWRGRRGLVTQALDAAQVPGLGARHAYLCGPPAMIDAAIAVLNQAGVAHAHIHYDKFLDAGDLARGPV